jgi:hypothetical protein
LRRTRPSFSVRVLASPAIEEYGGGEWVQSFIASCRKDSNVSLENVDSVYFFTIVNENG